MSNNVLPLTKDIAVKILKKLCDLDLEFKSIFNVCISNQMPFKIEDDFLYHFYTISKETVTPIDWSSEKRFIFFDLDNRFVEIIISVDKTNNLIIELEIWKPESDKFELFANPLEADIQVVPAQDY